MIRPRLPFLTTVLSLLLAALCTAASSGAEPDATTAPSISESASQSTGHIPVPVIADASDVGFRAQGLPDASDASVPALTARAVLTKFLRSHPNYRIEPFIMPEVGGSAMDTGPLMAIAAGVPPHAIYVNFRQSSTYISQGFLEPLEGLLARVLSDNPRVRETDANGKWLADPASTEVIRAIELMKERVPGPAWPVVYRANETDEGNPGRHVWALPTSNFVMALMYRKDLFQQAGLDPERAPQTWDELLEYSRKLTVPERRQYGMMFPTGHAVSWGMYTFLVSNGGRMVAERDGQWEVTYNTDEAAESILFLHELALGAFKPEGRETPIKGAALLMPPTGAWNIAWGQGRIGMVFEYVDEEVIGNINPNLVGLAPVPASPRGARGSEVNCRMLGVFSRGTPQQKLAVMRYLWFITSDEAKRIRTETFVENGFGTFVNPALLKQFGYESILRRVPEGWQEAFEAAMKDGVPEPYGQNTQNIYRWASEPINKALELPLGQMPRERALAEIKTLLDASAHEANVKMMGIIPPNVMRYRRIVAAVVAVVIALSFAVAVKRVWRHFSKVAGPTVAEMRNRRRRVIAYLLLVPAIGMTLLWQYVPLGGGLGMAFTDYQLVQDSAFVGVDNFANVLFDERFWASLWRTFYFVALTIGLGFWPPILLAILLQEVPTEFGRYVFRTVFFLPAIISGVIVMFLWGQLYDPSEHGVLNQLLLSLNTLGPIAATAVKGVTLALWLSLVGVLAWTAIRMDELSVPIRVVLGAASLAFLAVGAWTIDANGALSAVVGRFQLEPLRWAQSPELAMLCVVLPTVWAGSGPGSILYLAALKTVPDALYEAAEIDGASHLHKIVYIVLPQLKYLILIQFIAAVVGAFKGGTDYILALTGGGPNDATTVLPLEIFTRAFLDLRLGIGTAMAWILGAMLVGFTVYQMKMLSGAEFKAGR